jgi:hypothetical protein
MNHRFFAPVCGALLLLSPALARAQTQTGTHRDAQIAHWMEQDYGVIFVDTNIIQVTDAECPDVNLTFIRLEDKKKLYLKARSVSFLSPMFGQTLGGIQEIAAGDYVLGSIECTVNKSHEHLLGPHARFQIRAREIVNIGMFKMVMRNEQAIDFMEALKATVNAVEKQPTRTRRSIEPLSERALAYFKETAPRTFSKMTTRPMTLLGSPDGLLKPKNP